MGADDYRGIAPLEALATIGPGDTTGTETFQRYLYQCQVAVQRWLGTLALHGDCYILCEFVDDITLVTESEITFAQVKTRDRGAWTASQTLQRGGGLDALIRSYNLAKAAGHRGITRLELILEGPAGPHKDTQTLFEQPTNATDSQRTGLSSLGLQADDTDDFLRRLQITAQYYARQSIDAVTLRMLMAIAPGHSAVLETTYNTLLQRAIASHLALAENSDGDSPLVLQPRLGAEKSPRLRSHALSRDELLAILPPSPTLAAEQRKLLTTANSGPRGMTDLEFKLRVAGASEQTVSRAKARRAEASAVLAGRASIGGETDSAVLTLQERVIEFAEGVTADIVATASPDAVKRQPANAIWGRLVQQVGILGDLDLDGVFSREGSRVLGYLCDLSDRCLFGWREE